MEQNEPGEKTRVVNMRGSSLAGIATSLLGLYFIRKGLGRRRSLLARLFLFYSGGKLIGSGKRRWRQSDLVHSLMSESFQITRETEMNGEADKFFTHLNQPEFIQAVLETTEWPQLTPAMSESDRRRWLRATTAQGIGAEVEFAHETDGHSLCWKCLEPEHFAHSGTLDAIPTDQPGKFRLRLNLIFTEKNGGPRFSRHEIRSMDRFIRSCLERMKQAYESESFSIATTAGTTVPNRKSEQTGNISV